MRGSTIKGTKYTKDDFCVPVVSGGYTHDARQSIECALETAVFPTCVLFTVPIQIVTINKLSFFSRLDIECSLWVRQCTKLFISISSFHLCSAL